MRCSHFRLLTGGLALALLGTACGGVQSTATGSDFNAKEYFSGKTIRIVTSSSPGGTTDLKARAIAAHLGQFIPGNPRLKVSNVTPHVAGLNYTWNAPTDGTVIDIESSSPLEFELFEQAKWNSAKFRYLGSVDSRCKDILFMRGNVDYKNMRDASGSASPQLVTMGEAPNPASVPPMLLGQMLVAKYLDLPFQVQPVAESDTSALLLALQRGDINVVRLGQDWCKLPQTHPQWLKTDYLIPVLNISPTPPDQQGKELIREKLGQDVPYVSEVLTKQQMKQWRSVVATRRAGGNPVFLPPGTPDNITKALREAWSQAAKDPQFRKAMQKAYSVSNLKWRSAEQYTQLVEKNRKALYRQKDKIRPLTERMFSRYAQ